MLLRLNRPSSTLTPQCFFHYHEKQRGAPYTPHPPPQCDNTAGLSGRDGVSAAAEQLLLLGVFTASSRTPISDTGGMLLKTQGPADVCVCVRAREIMCDWICVCARARHCQCISCEFPKSHSPVFLSTGALGSRDSSAKVRAAAHSQIPLLHMAVGVWTDVHCLKECCCVCVCFLYSGASGLHTVNGDLLTLLLMAGWCWQAGVKLKAGACQQ